MNVAIIGTGYVGLTTGVALAYLGNQVWCLDVDERKLAMLAAGKTPIYEPWLEELMALARPNLRFTSNYQDAVGAADVIFIAVGTPSRPDGSPDLQYLRQAAESVGAALGPRFTVVVNKSTVPIGSSNWVEALVRDARDRQGKGNGQGAFAVASNPEFLREGSALSDTLYADRIVTGSDNPRALEVLYQLYKPIAEQSFTAPAFLPRPEGMAAAPLLTTDLASAELIKYAANAFLALKISFINEISLLSEKVGADVALVAKGIGLDSRIGTRFLQAGIGWGGSCFAKDTAALIATAHEYGVSLPIVKAAREVNFLQRGRVIEKLLAELKIIKGKTIGLLGLAFKANTDDLRDAPALDIAARLIERGARVRVHDPIAMERCRREHPQLEVIYCGSVPELATDCDALVLVTEWPEYREADWAAAGAVMRNRFLLDGRNYISRAAVEAQGFRYAGFGR